MAKKGILLIRNNKINSKRHLTRSRIYLNDNGVSALVRNFKTYLTDFEWQIDQGIQNINRSSSLNGGRAFLNDIKKSNNRVKNARDTIIGHLNITNIGHENKYIFAEKKIQGFDIFLVFEFKLDNTFPTNLFKINGYRTFSNERNWSEGGLFL